MHKVDIRRLTSCPGIVIIIIIIFIIIIIIISLLCNRISYFGYKQHRRLKCRTVRNSAGSGICQPPWTVYNSEYVVDFGHVGLSYIELICMVV